MKSGLVARISEETVFVLSYAVMSRLKVSRNRVGDCPFGVTKTARSPRVASESDSLQIELLLLFIKSTRIFF